MNDIDKEELQKLRNSPSYFVQKVIGKDPYAYQKEVIDSNNDRKAIVGGRQIGKTTMMAWMAIHEFVMFPNQKILLTAPTQRQALNFMSKLKAEIDDWVDSPDQYGLETVQKSKIKGKNGSWIKALPAIKETIRGLTIDSAFVDEAAFIDRHILTSVISPMLATTDGQYVLGSTAWGKEGYFYDKIEDEEQQEYWYSRRIASMENPEIPTSQIEEWRRDMTQMEFEREVLGQFSDKKNAFFKNKDVNRCLEWTADLPQGSNVVYPDKASRTAFMGVDPAGQGEDAAVFTSIDEDWNVFEVKKEQDIDIPEVEGTIRDLIGKDDRNYVKVLVEENGVGEGIIGHLEEEFREVEGFRTTLRSKESIYNETKEKMQAGKMNLPDRQDLKSQLRSIEYEMTSRGNMKIHAPEGKHDDMADSLCLASAALSGKRHHVERVTETMTFGSSPGRSGSSFNF